MCWVSIFPLYKNIINLYEFVIYNVYLYYSYFTWFQEDDKWETMDKSEFPDEYLPVLNSTMAKEPCIHKSLLKIWQKDRKNIDKLTKARILKDVTATLQNK